jgi:hypothetical protein
MGQTVTVAAFYGKNAIAALESALWRLDQRSSSKRKEDYSYIKRGIT